VEAPGGVPFCAGGERVADSDGRRGQAMPWPGQPGLGPVPGRAGAGPGSGLGLDMPGPGRQDHRKAGRSLWQKGKKSIAEAGRSHLPGQALRPCPGDVPGRVPGRGWAGWPRPGDGQLAPRPG